MGKTLRTATALLIAALLASGCAAADAGDGGASGGSAGGSGGDPVVTAASCDELTAADDMRSIVDLNDPLETTQVRFGEDGLLLEVGCGIRTADRDRGITVGLTIDWTACTEPQLGTTDPEDPRGWYLTAANGGIAYWMCMDDGAGLHAHYISMAAVPGPSVGQMRMIVTSTMDQLELLHAIAEALREGSAAAGTPTAEPTDGCLELPAELRALGVMLEGCVLEVVPNDLGGVTARIEVVGDSAFDTVSEALAASGLETVYCTDAPRFCGWSGEAGNADVTYEPPVLVIDVW